MKPVYVLVTMDCERPYPETQKLIKQPLGYRQTGPDDPEHSRNAILGYWNVAQACGFPVTYFIHPETAVLHRNLFLSLQAQGACLGLHIHPWKYADGRYSGHFGEMSEDMQRALLKEAIEMWEDALGHRPVYFRPGTFSANDSTYRVLCDLGFSGGSVSIPGRVWPEFACIWAGADPHPHRAHPYFRQLCGELPFVEVPLSVDFQLPVHDGNAFYYQDLRPDRNIAHQTVLKDILGRLAAAEGKCLTLSLDTHNDHDFSDREHLWYRRLVSVLESIHPMCRALGMEAVGSTIAEVCAMI